ncbi:MAG: hypothetical protein ACREJ6_04305 [Candidatus Methylomirabilis sp.]
MPGLASANDFLRALWGDAKGIVELRCPAPKLPAFKGVATRQEFFQYPDQLHALLALANQIDEQLTNFIYFGLYLKSKARGRADDTQTVTALWVDLDFKGFTREEAKERLKTFPLRPSAGVFTGGGFHIYWFLREPVMGDALRKIPGYNKALAKALGGDPQRGTLADCPRLPGTRNVKHTPAVPIEVVAWRPDARYTLDDFGFLSIEEPAPPPPAVDLETAMPKAALDMPPELREKLAPLMQKLWRDGHRHTAALFLSGLLLKNGVQPDSIKELFRAVCTLTGDSELEDRLHTVDETVQRFKENPTGVAGASKLEEMIREFPPDLHVAADRALRTVTATMKQLAAQQKDEDADLGIARMGKINSRPAIWEIVVTTRGKEWPVKCDTETAMQLVKFRRLVFEEHNIILPNVSAGYWERLLEQAPKQVTEIESEEATPAGYLGRLIQDFEIKAQPEKAAETALQVVPILMDTGETVLRLSALLRYLRSEGVDRRGREQVIEVLRQTGYKPILRRVGKKSSPTRVWTKEVHKTGSNGQADEKPEEIVSE